MQFLRSSNPSPDLSDRNEDAILNHNKFNEKLTHTVEISKIAIKNGVSTSVTFAHSVFQDFKDFLNKGNVFDLVSFI